MYKVFSAQITVEIENHPKQMMFVYTDPLSTFFYQLENLKSNWTNLVTQEMCDCGLPFELIIKMMFANWRHELLPSIDIRGVSQRRFEIYISWLLKKPSQCWKHTGRRRFLFDSNNDCCEQAFFPMQLHLADDWSA